MSENMERTKKNKILRRLLAGFYRGSTVREREEREKERLERYRSSPYYRGRPRMKSELKKGKSKKDKERLRKQEEALGITVVT